MKQKIEQVIKNRKLVITLMECLVAIGIIIALVIMIMPKDKLLDTTYSYSKVNTEVSEYTIDGNYMTRVMPLTDYTTFKKIAENTLNSGRRKKLYGKSLFR